MPAKPSKFKMGYNFIGEFVEDASSFKVVHRPPVSESNPSIRESKPQPPRPRGKKPKKKKG